MSGLYAGRQLLKKFKQFKKPKRNRYSAKAEGSPIFRAIVTGKSFVEARQPSSGMRKVVKVQIIKNGKPAIAYVPGDLASNFISQNDEVLIQGINGSKGGTMGDIPTTTFKVVSVNKMSLKHLAIGKKSTLNI